jgi:hypothetical protein
MAVLSATTGRAVGHERGVQSIAIYGSRSSMTVERFVLGLTG